MKSIFGSHINLTAKVLDMRLERQNTVMANMANVSTPGYKATRIDFEGRLQQALGQDVRGKMTRTSNAHMPAVFNANGFESRDIQAFKAREVHGEDSVDLDKEMTVMTKNGMMYNALASVIRNNFTGMQKVIQSGAK